MTPLIRRSTKQPSGATLMVRGAARQIMLMCHHTDGGCRAAPRTIKVAPDGCFVDLLINGVILIHRYLPPKEPLVLVTTVTTLPEPSTLASMRNPAALSRPPTHHTATLISCDPNPPIIPLTCNCHPY